MSSTTHETGKEVEMFQRLIPVIVLTLVVAAAPSPAWASFSGTDVYLPSVGRGPGAMSSDWFTTVWVHNPTEQMAQFQVSFLERGMSNPGPPVFNGVIPPQETFKVHNAVEDLFGLQNAFGALRITSDQRLIVNSRIYSVPGEGGEADSAGQFFSAVPSAFAIAQGESTVLLGVHQTEPRDQSEYRYNFGFVETAGGNATVDVRAFLGVDPTVVVASKQYQLGPYGALQHNVADLGPVDGDNVRLEVEVVSGGGRVIAFGSGLANLSNDPSTFEMAFDDGLLSGGSTTSVEHDASLTGEGTTASPLGIATGGVVPEHVGAANTPSDGDSLVFSGGGFQWQSVGGGGGGPVVHDASLAGDGTSGSPLGIATGGVIAGHIGAGNAPSDGDALVYSAGGLQWQAVSGGGGLTLPYAGATATATPAFQVSNGGTGAGLRGHSVEGFGGFFASDNDHFDLALGGPVGRVNTDPADENSQLYLSSNADMILKLDNDGGEDHMLRVKNSGGNDLCTVNERGTLTCVDETGNGTGVAGIAPNGSNAWGVTGESDEGIGVRGRSVDGWGGYFVSVNDDHRDLALGGNVGRLNTDWTDEHSQLYLSSNADIVLKLDNDGGEDHVLRVKNSGGNDVFTIDEAGTFTATGNKNAVVETASYGRRLLSAVESPGVWFEDFGTVHLAGGEALVEIDPVFAETVNLEAPYHVYLTPVGPDPAVVSVADKGPAFFRVVGRSLDGAPASVEVDYRIVARRRGYEEVRLASPAR